MLPIFKDLGIIGLVQFLPVLLLVFVTGSVADRFGRRTVMTLAIAAEAVCAIASLNGTTLHDRVLQVWFKTQPT